VRILVDGRDVIVPGTRVRLVDGGPIQRSAVVTEVSIVGRGRTYFQVAFVNSDGERVEVRGIEEFELEPVEAPCHGDAR